MNNVRWIRDAEKYLNLIKERELRKVLSNNLQNAQNYTFWIKEYNKVFNFTIIKNKELNFELWAFFLLFILFSPWIIGYVLGRLWFPWFVGLILLLFVFFKLYKYIIMTVFKNKCIIYKKTPKKFNEMKKGYWIKEYYKAISFRNELVEKYFIIIKK